MNILVADDDFITRRLLKNMLETLGHEVIEAEDGIQAWDLIQMENIRMVITDWMMPGMDGVELCKAVRGKKTPGYVFVIILTSKDAQDDLIFGLEAGADDYLCKPFEKAELIARLNTGLRVLNLEASLQQAYEEIKQLSVTDSLTGCFNRRYLNDHLFHEIKRAERYNQPLSMVLCDIDHFKKVNDEYGHIAGDRVLEAFGRFLREAVRERVDWVARYGGEEFAVVLPETDVSGGVSLAERLRIGTSHLAVETKQAAIRITASFGVTGINPDTPRNALNPESLVRQADKHLYQAKADGRNRVACGPFIDEA